MNRLAILMALLIAAVARAQDPIDLAVEQLEAERFEDAMRTLEPLRSDPGANEEVLGLWQDALRGVARDVQRVRGYAAALEFLEQHLDSRSIIADYVETCIWAGDEERGLRTIAALPQPLRDRCAHSEFQLHYKRLDFAALERRAREVKWQSWIDFASKERKLRERFDDRRTRAIWVAVIGSLVIALGGWGVVRLLARPVPERL